MLTTPPAPGDVLLLPSGRHVRVEQIIGARVGCVYCDAQGVPVYGDSSREGGVDLALAFATANARHVRALLSV